MFGSGILEIVFGMIFIFLLLSLLATVINELIASFLRLRANNLKEAVYRMLEDSPQKQSGLAKAFFDHPLVKKLGKKAGAPPSYIPSATFSQVLRDVLKGIEDPDETLAPLRKAVNDLPDSETKKSLISLLNKAGEKTEDFSKNLEQWFNSTMERASGWFKRRMQLITLGIGMVMAVALNADSIYVFRKLNKDDKVRSHLAALAETYIATEHTRQGQTSAPVTLDTDDADTSENRSSESSQRRTRPGAGDDVSKLVSEYRKLMDEDLKDANRLLGLGWKSIDYELETFRCGPQPKSRQRPQAQDRRERARPENGARTEERGGQRAEDRPERTDRERPQRTHQQDRPQREDRPDQQQARPARSPRPTATPAAKQSDDWSTFLRCSPVTFWFLKGIGWLITALAISLGAPFWFDLLKKVSNIRGTGAKPDNVKS